MIYIKTPIDNRVGVDPKNLWIVDQGLVHYMDWRWNFCDGHSKHLHCFNDEHGKIAALFALRWS